jgi:vancomycin resistance protein YoaR
MVQTITRSLVFALIFTSVLIGALAWYLYVQNQKYSNTVYPNVYVNSQSFEGKTSKDISSHFEPINKQLRDVHVQLVYQDRIATFSGELLKLKYDDTYIADQVMLVGRSPELLSMVTQRLTSLLNLGSYSFSYLPMYDLQPIEDYLGELESIYNIPAQNALFEFDEKTKKVSEFKLEKPGQILQSDKTLQELKNFLSRKELTKLGSSPVVFTITQTVLEPELTIADANDLGIKEKIGEGKSDYSGSSSEREHNVVLAASKFHGVLIAPGEVFSYNKTVGDISVSTGYKTAYVIKNGRTVLGDGGGVCQDSTTLFRAALNTGLPIIERHAHAYRVKYYENDSKAGLDATVYNPTADLRFKNDTPGYILIQTKVDTAANHLAFEFYGTSDGRKVELTEPVVYDIRPAPEPLYQDDPTLPKGTIKQVDWAAAGAKSSFSYKVTQTNGDVSQDRTFFSNFRPWQAVFLVGTQ